MGVLALDRIFVAAAVFATLTVPPSGAGYAETPGGAAEGWEARLRRDVAYLASDGLRGRSATGETIELAADYIAERFESIGLRTDLFDGEPFQPVDVPLTPRPGPAEDNRGRFTLPASPADGSREIEVNLGDGMRPLAVGAAEAELTAPVAFVGYGITASGRDYDDYDRLDVRDKWVIALRKEPGMDDPESPFDGTDITRHAYFQTKIENAVSHGAGGVLLVNDRASRDEAVREVEEKIEAERRRARETSAALSELPDEAANARESLRERLERIEASIEGLREEREAAARGLLEVGEAGRRPESKTEIPVASLSRDVADELLRTSLDRSLESLERVIDETYRPHSRLLEGVTLQLRSRVAESTATSDNVLGVLKGQGPLAEQTLVVGAHYDHVGMGGFGSLAPGTYAVHNGADDNASGTAMLMALADRLADELASVSSHRRIVFIAFTAEERGLLGSQAYVGSPRFPLEQTVAMVNLDMVGRLKDNELSVYGTGTADCMDAIVEKANASRGFELFKFATGYGPSDHQSFYQVGIPVVFFNTGLHRDYHRPSDDFDKIDFGGMSRITDMVYGVTKRLAVRPDRPGFVETGKRFRIRRQRTAYLGVTLSETNDRVTLSGVVPEGPADVGGLRAGDRLKRLGDRRVDSTSDVLETLRARSPGETVEVQVERGGEPRAVKVRLRARP